MQLDRKVLAFGQLPSSKGDLYVPASGRKGYAHNLTLHNTNTTSEDVVLNYYDGTNEHEILSETIPAGDSLYLAFPGEGEVVGIGGKFTGNTTTASKVTFKFSGTEEIPDAILPSGGPANLWYPPASPNVLNDEFEESTLSGWTGVQNVTDSVAGSFSYDTVDPYDTTFNSGNVVRVSVNNSLRPSWALIQPPGSYKEFRIYKAITIPTNLLVLARLKFNNRTSIVTDDSTFVLELVDSVGGVPTLNGRIALYLNESDVGTIQAQSQSVSSGGSASGVANTTNVNAQGQALEYVAIHKIGTTFHTWVGTASGNWIYLNSYSGLDYTPDMVTIGVTASSVTAPGPLVMGIDFIRFFETDKFLL